MGENKKVLVLIGRSGVGKTNMFRRLTKEYPNEVHGVVSVTTRPMRKGEEDGVDYHYRTHEDFKRYIKEEKLIEHIQYNGEQYGLLGEDFVDDKINVVVVEPTGLEQLRKILSKAEFIVVHIQEPDDVVLKRLMRRPDRSGSLKRFKTDPTHFKNVKGDINISSTFEDVELLFELFET